MPFESVVVRLLVATLLSTVIGVERELKSRPAGMRTYVLVCLGACTIALIESQFIAVTPDPEATHVGYSFGRLSAQVISGVGFLGAGTILFSERKVTGLTTAASLWNVACIGLAIGFGYYWIALLVEALVLLTLLMMRRIVRVRVLKRVQIQFIHRVETIEYLNSYFREHDIEPTDINFSAEQRENGTVFTNVYTLHTPSHFNYADMVSDLSGHENILSVRTTTI